MKGRGKASWTLIVSVAVAFSASSGVAMMSEEDGEAFGSSPAMSLSCTVPPAIVWMEDSQGRRSGVDPSRPIGPIGQGTGIEEIPLSQVMDQNISSDDPPTLGEQNPTTRWSVDLASKTPQVYTVHLVGLKDGVEKVDMGRSDLTPGTASNIVYEAISINVLVTSGGARDLVVYFDPSWPKVEVVRVVSPKDLGVGIDIACRLGHVAPGGICTSLKEKAEAAASAKARGNTKAARRVWQAFLRELRAQGEKHVQEPALTILREEAETLLNPPLPMPKPKKPKAGTAAKPEK